MPGARFLGLFCGSGAAGLEALSRGARAAVLVADYTGPQAEIMPRRLLARQIERAGEAGFDVLAAFLPLNLAAAMGVDARQRTRDRGHEARKVRRT